MGKERDYSFSVIFSTLAELSTSGVDQISWNTKKNPKNSSITIRNPRALTWTLEIEIPKISIQLSLVASQTIGEKVPSSS